MKIQDGLVYIICKKILNTITLDHKFTMKVYKKLEKMMTGILGQQSLIILL